MVVGAQSYTVRAFMQTERDIRRSLQMIARVGYSTVQISGVGPIAPERLRALCDEAGLRVVLTHISEQRILEDTDAVIREHSVLGCRYIGLGSMPERYRTNAVEWLGYFAEDFLPAARKIRDAGMRFMYHNHSFEFTRLPDGRTLLDMLLDAFAPDLMGITLDTYWVHAAGYDVCQTIERLSGRLPCVHLKDMVMEGTSCRMAPVGEGNLDFEGILRTLARLGDTQYLLVEQDTCDESPFVCLRKSYDNLARMGYA